MSDYTGEVSPGGEPDRRTAGALEITKLAVDPQMHNNCYLLRCTDTGDQVLIDAADEPDRLLELIGDGGLTTVVTTHQHWDHHRALADVLRATGARSAAGREDGPHLPVAPDVLLDQGDSVPLGALTLDVVHLRGHTPGSVALVLRSSDGSTHVFTGDSLFPGGVGNTDKDPQRFTQLIGDVEERLFGVLPDEAWVYPGHGGDTTIGAERPHLAEWRQRGW